MFVKKMDFDESSILFSNFTENFAKMLNNFFAKMNKMFVFEHQRTEQIFATEVERKFGNPH